MVKITFDLDGVIIPNIEKSCELFGIDYTKITTYKINDCKLLTEEEKAKIKSGFTRAEIFEYSGTSFGSEYMEDLAQKCEMHINSLCGSDEVKEYKKELLKKLIPSLNFDNINLGDCGEFVVKLFDETDVVVEDCLENLLNNYDKFKRAYLIDHLYNRDIDISKYDKIIRVSNLKQAIDKILECDLR